MNVEGKHKLKLLFIGEDNRWIEEIVLALRVRWQEVSPTVASSLAPAVDLIIRGEVDLVFLMPNSSPQHVPPLITQIRKRSNIPIVVVVGQEDEAHVLGMIELGADDYLVMPCNSVIITASAVAVLRRVDINREALSEQAIHCGDLVVNPHTYDVMLGDERLELTPTEFRLLYLLATNKNSTLTQDFILGLIWSTDASSEYSLKKYIQRLRIKLGDDARHPKWIRTIRGVGYRLVSPT